MTKLAQFLMIFPFWSLYHYFPFLSFSYVAKIHAVQLFQKLSVSFFRRITLTFDTVNKINP